MTAFHFAVEDELGTERLGQALASHLPAGTTIALHGTLGAGKTRLVQAVAAACGIERRDVLSPTFVLCQHYRGSRRINHYDVYRLKDEDEFTQLGPEESFESDGLTFVEWADKFPDCLPDERLEITIRLTGERSRVFEITATGAELESVVREIQVALT